MATLFRMPSSTLSAPSRLSCTSHPAWVKTAAFSGWALDGHFSYASGIDAAFPVSDHCGFDELMEFAKRCDPDYVFTTHGFAKEFAHEVRRTLGIQAQPLIARQHTLDHFC
jgi:putative mRNA 3-end processing factor